MLPRNAVDIVTFLVDNFLYFCHCMFICVVWQQSEVCSWRFTAAWLTFLKSSWLLTLTDGCLHHCWFRNWSVWLPVWEINQSNLMRWRDQTHTGGRGGSEMWRKTLHFDFSWCRSQCAFPRLVRWRPYSSHRAAEWEEGKLFRCLCVADVQKLTRSIQFSLNLLGLFSGNAAS